MGARGENWPLQNGQPMLALAQVNLTGLPFRTPGLGDIDFITIFIGPEKLPSLHEKNGSNWVLRAYKTIADLVPLEKQYAPSSIKPFQMQPKVIEHDFPCFDDVPFALKEQLWDAYDANQFENVEGFKLGGWPNLIQSEITWAPGDQHPSNPQYVFQIDSTEKGNWMWADNGVGYFGRGTAVGKGDDWFLEWQCF
ncbi:MAG: DUF1963 domain-containing protein [Anaerolineae bacterium]|nr:DUF1963 domain-containing protein [Anaerolineae bacterium]